MGVYDEFHALSRALAVIQVVTAPELETAFLLAAVESPIKRWTLLISWLPYTQHYLLVSLLG